MKQTESRKDPVEAPGAQATPVAKRLDELDRRIAVLRQEVKEFALENMAFLANIRGVMEQERLMARAERVKDFTAAALGGFCANGPMQCGVAQAKGTIDDNDCAKACLALAVAQNTAFEKWLAEEEQADAPATP